MPGYFSKLISNNFTCEESVCEFAGWYGNDKYYKTFFQKLFPKTFIIKDFKVYNNDKLVLYSKDIEIKESKDRKTVKIISGKDEYILEGVNEKKVERWLEVARTPKNGTYIEIRKDGTVKIYTGKDLINKKNRNPIQIE